MLVSFFLKSNAQNDSTDIAFKELVVEKDTVQFYHQNSMKRLIPNQPIHIIVGTFEDTFLDSVENSYDSNKSNKYMHVLYLKVPMEKIGLNVVSSCLEQLFYKYFHDRNRVYLSIRETFDLNEEKKLDINLSKFAGVWVTSDTYNSYEGYKENIYPFESIDPYNLDLNSKSYTSYELVTIKEMEALQEFKKRNDSYLETKGKHLITLTNGFFQVSKSRAVAFDEETMVDLSNYNSLWTLSYEYMISERLGLGLTFGLIAKKDGSINGGMSGGAITKLGISTRFLAYKTSRFHLYPGISLGSLSATIGGGSVGFASTPVGTSLSIDQSGKLNQKSIFMEFRIGVDYRLAKNIFLTGSVQHSQSNFEDNFGSISGFSGSGINLGLGFVF